MIRENKGFTLMELLAVIVIIAVVVSVASVSINAVTKNAREKASEEMRGSLKDAAIIHALDSVYLQKCTGNFSESDYSSWSRRKCATKITVSTLKSKGLFEDNRGYCSNDTEVIVYRYSDETSVNSNYDAYVSDDACTNY